MFKILLRTLKFIGSYKKRVIAAFVFSFFRAILINSPLILAYLVIMNFYKGTPDPHIVLYTSLGVVGSILLQALLAHTSDRLQSGAGFEWDSLQKEILDVSAPSFLPIWFLSKKMQ